jgi:hypothetical protein
VSGCRTTTEYLGSAITQQLCANPLMGASKAAGDSAVGPVGGARKS